MIVIDGIRTTAAGDIIMIRHLGSAQGWGVGGCGLGLGVWVCVVRAPLSLCGWWDSAMVLAAAMGRLGLYWLAGGILGGLAFSGFWHFLG